MLDWTSQPEFRVELLQIITPVEARPRKVKNGEEPESLAPRWCPQSFTSVV